MGVGANPDWTRKDPRGHQEVKGQRAEAKLISEMLTLAAVATKGEILLYIT